MAKYININGKEYPVYATVEKADEYLAAFFNSGWAAIYAEAKSTLLVSAARSIDSMQFVGEKDVEE